MVFLGFGFPGRVVWGLVHYALCGCGEVFGWALRFWCLRWWVVWLSWFGQFVCFGEFGLLRGFSGLLRDLFCCGVGII